MFGCPLLSDALNGKIMKGLIYDLDLLTTIIERGAGNYVVSFLLYEVDHDQGATLEEIVQSSINGAKIGNSSTATTDDVLRDVRDGIEYEGDESHGPAQEDLKSKQFLETKGRVMAELLAILNKADRILHFTFQDGHPAYPVYWDFAYLIGGRTHSYVFVGSSSD
jgi:hypothetical protein